MIAIWIMVSVAYRKSKSEITKGGRKGQKNPLSANIEGKQKSVHQREHSRGHTALRS